MDANGVYIVYLNIYIYLYIYAYISLHTFTTRHCDVSLLKTPHSSFPPGGLCGWDPLICVCTTILPCGMRRRAEKQCLVETSITGNGFGGMDWDCGTLDQTSHVEPHNIFVAWRFYRLRSSKLIASNSNCSLFKSTQEWLKLNRCALTRGITDISSALLSIDWQQLIMLRYVKRVLCCNRYEFQGMNYYIQIVTFPLFWSKSSALHKNAGNISICNHRPRCTWFLLGLMRMMQVRALGN